MNLEKVVFGFFIGDIDDPELHNPFELFAAWRCLVLSVRVPLDTEGRNSDAPHRRTPVASC
jgi:hypothetical protein